MEYLDWRGNEFKEGETVLYPVRNGSSVKLVEGVIKEIEPIEVTTNFGRRLRNFALWVHPIAENSYGRLSLRENKKPVRLTAVEKVTVLGYE